MRPKISMREALADPDLFGPILAGASWYGWRVLLIAAAGEELTDDERGEFRRLTGRAREPGKMVRDLAAISGRRGGKTEALAVFNCWLSALCDHRDVLTPGEVGVALVISRDQRAAITMLDRIEGILRYSVILGQLIANRTADTIELTTGIVLEVRPCNRISVRSPTYISIVADEVAHWFTSTDFANPDAEVLGAARPGLMTTRGPVLMASSVYAKTGVLYDVFKKYFGPNGPADTLVAFGTSRDFNPSLSQAEIDRELERDPVRNRAEYLSEWRDDIAGFIPREIVESCVADYVELPPRSGINYRCFIDPASGVVEGDSFTIAISHRVGDRITIDAVRECKPPFSPSEVINTVLLPLCKQYGIYKVTGDNYGGEYPKELCRKAGISYELAKKYKSELYADPFLSLLNSKKIELPRHERAIAQICGLERSLQRSGREQISHPTHGRDDIANAIAGAADCARGTGNYRLDVFDPNFRDEDLPPLQQPEPAAPRCNGDWWRSMPRSQPIFSADERLHGLYQSLDFAFKFGFFR